MLFIELNQVSESLNQVLPEPAYGLLVVIDDLEEVETVVPLLQLLLPVLDVLSRF